MPPPGTPLWPPLSAAPLRGLKAASAGEARPAKETGAQNEIGALGAGIIASAKGEAFYSQIKSSPTPA